MTEDELRKRIEQAAKDGTTELYLFNRRPTSLPPEIGQLAKLKALVRGRGDKPGLLDLRQTAGDDPNRIARMQLAELFEAIAPDNYQARQWGPLRRVRMGDNTYRWMCDEHARRMDR